MKHIFNLLILAVTAVLLSSCNNSTGNNAGTLSLEELIENFNNPPTAYKAKPFWSWNGKLNEKELVRQIEVMEKMGFGGFFMHSRTGLETEYLG
ncbi:MAG: hypothetical protein MI922_23280, partial [Bacteroidales bacterium]|nr:hypothetical protein [Bacteroidales bacterium]